MRRFYVIIAVMLALLTAVSLADVQYYYGNPATQESSYNFDIGVYYRSTTISPSGSSSDYTFDGIGINLFYGANNYHFLLDFYSGHDSSIDVDLRDFNFGVGYTYTPSQESSYKLLATLLFRNIDFSSNYSSDNYNGIGLGLQLVGKASQTEGTNFGYHIGIVWFPSYSGSDYYSDINSFGWVVGGEVKFSQNWAIFLDYIGENFNYDYSGGSSDENWSTWKVGIAYKFE